MMNTTERFWAKVDKSGDCWLWTGCKDKNGYGKFRSNKRIISAHRFAYELFIGLVPSGLELDHLCRNRSCVNYSHLEPVTHYVNMLRSPLQGARQKAKTHCPSGHKYGIENIYFYKNERKCRACLRANSRKYYWKSAGVSV